MNYDTFAQAYLNMFQQPLQETTLSDEEKKRIDTEKRINKISDETQEKIHKALGHKQFVTFPITDNSEADPDVVDHLAQHGYDVHDYKAGIAAKKITVGDPSRGIPLREKVVHHNIGSVLQKTGADPEIVKAYMNDPARSNKTVKDLHVCITKTPCGVAGMSTGTHWTSCMNLNTGSNKQYVKGDLEHGTHIAYLVNHDDHDAFKYGEPSKPLARIAIKPFHDSSNLNGDTIYRPETTTYGNSTVAFENAVHKWSVDNYPAKLDLEYHKNHELYNDSDNVYTAITPEKLHSKIMHEDHNLDGIIQDPDSINGAIEKLKQTPNVKEEHIKTALRIPNLNMKHIRALKDIAQSKNFDTTSDDGMTIKKMIGIYHGEKLPSKELPAYTNDPSSLSGNILRHKKLPDSVIDSLNLEQLGQIQRNKIKSHHVDNAAQYVKYAGVDSSVFHDFSWAFKSHHLDNMLDITHASQHSAYAYKELFEHPEFTKKHHNAFIDNLNNQSDSNKKKAFALKLLKHSKYASMSDVDELSDITNVKQHINSLMLNERTPESVHKEVADYLMDKFKQPIGKDDSSLKMGDNYPPHITKHFDYDKLASMPMNITRFESSHDATKYGDAVLRKIDHENPNSPENKKYITKLHSLLGKPRLDADTISDWTRKMYLKYPHMVHLMK